MLRRATLRFGPITLADRVFQPGLVMDLVLVFCGAGLIAIIAQVSVPLWPVPTTGQIAGILIVGYSLGMVRGTLAAGIYVGMGAIGLPVFSNGAGGLDRLLGSTGGFIFGFVLGALVAGIFAAKQWDRTFGRVVLASTICTLVIYAVGLPWLAVANDYSVRQTIELGLYPLILGAVLKIVVVSALMTGAWSYIHRFDRRAASAEAWAIGNDPRRSF
ncbi:biotin transporter BioY [Homoserinimonas aerilata]|uniref:biotin transporter BioY n=1 Tax=Homoserinimonas aerilata TaxID=1162970 RepID=UPI001639622D|nr:biotin transporter BioY [Homoserinimonas aerilata]